MEDVRHSLEIEEYLTPNEEMLFWEKIGERRKGNVFPKSRNNDSIFMIGNKLVYVGRGYIKPKINRIVEVSVKEDSDSENTYASFVQEDIINEYEKNRKYEGRQTLLFFMVHGQKKKDQIIS